MNSSLSRSFLAPVLFLIAAPASLLAQTTPSNPVNPATLPTSDRAPLTPPAKPCPAADAPPDDITYFIRQKAFDAIALHQPAEARRLMRCAILADPHDQIALRQEVYLDIDAGGASDAIGDIEALRKLGFTDPQLDAQEGYIYAEQKHYDLAKQAFRRAIETGDNDTRLSSFAALRTINAEYAGRSIEFSVDSQYLNRFNDGVVDASVHLNQRLGHASPVQAYLNARLLRDTASQVGKLPEIFDDNAFLFGLGLVFQPAQAHYALSAEANEAYVFYAGRNHTAALVPDFRAVAGYFNIFRPRPESRLPQRLSLQANGSIGFYSRYDRDVIAYLQPQESIDVLSRERYRLAPYLQENFAFDTNQQYYNNIAEMIPGLALSFKHFANAVLSAEYVRGYYLPFHTNSPNPYGSTYNDFRIHLTLSKSLPLVRRGERP
jgi:hypothetical protein